MTLRKPLVILVGLAVVVGLVAGVVLLGRGGAADGPSVLPPHDAPVEGLAPRAVFDAGSAGPAKVLSGVTTGRRAVVAGDEDPFIGHLFEVASSSPDLQAMLGPRDQQQPVACPDLSDFDAPGAIEEKLPECWFAAPLAETTRETCRVSVFCRWTFHRAGRCGGCVERWKPQCAALAVMEGRVTGFKRFPENDGNFELTATRTRGLPIVVTTRALAEGALHRDHFLLRAGGECSMDWTPLDGRYTEQGTGQTMQISASATAPDQGSEFSVTLSSRTSRAQDLAVVVFDPAVPSLTVRAPDGRMSELEFDGDGVSLRSPEGALRIFAAGR